MTQLLYGVTKMDQKDIDKIADAMVTRIQKTHHNFWIDPQRHYDDHMSMREVIQSWRSGKSIFTKIFIGLLVVGSITLAMVGLGIKIKGG